MKTFKLLTLATLLILSTNTAFAATSSKYVDVNGLVCDFCARALEKVFGKQDAVQDIDVNLDTKVVTINFKDNQTMEDRNITKLIMDAGYNVVAIRDTNEVAAPTEKDASHE